MHIGQDVKVLVNGKELLVRNVEVSYTCDDLPSVSIEGFMPRDYEVTMEVTAKDTTADVLKKMLDEVQMNSTYIGTDCAFEGDDRTVAMEYAMKAHEIKMNTTKEWSDKETNTMRGYDESCEKACADDGSYGAHGLAKKVVNLGLDERQKLIKKYELTRDDGTLTERGRELLLTILFETYEDEVIEALEALEEERKADK